MRGKGKEKAFEWLANHASDVHAVGLSLKRIAKVIQESDFTKLFDEKIEKNADFLQNCGDFDKNEPVEDHVCFSIVDDKKKIDELEKGEKKWGKGKGLNRLCPSPKSREKKGQHRKKMF